MKDKIKNGYFFFYLIGNRYEVLLKVGSRCYILPLTEANINKLILFKNIEEDKIDSIFKPNGERII